MPGRTTRRAALVLASLVALAVLASVAFARYTPSGTPTEVLAAISARHVHGSADDLLSIDAIERKAKHGPVMLTCGAVSVWAVDLLARSGHRARIVTTLTRERWNSADNGHTLIEVWEGRWVLYDIDRHVRYEGADGPLDLAGVVTAKGAYRIVPLAGPVGEGAIRESNARLLQIPGVAEDGLYWFAAEGAEAARVESYAPNYRALPAAEWVARFYPEIR